MSVLTGITELWLKQIEHCKKTKEKAFGKTAKRAWDFLGKNYRQLYLESREDDFLTVPNPTYKTRLNKSREYVSIMLPFLMHRVPNRIVQPRRPQIPTELIAMMPQVAQYQQALSSQEELQSWLSQWFLNYIPAEYNLLRESRTAIPEALVKGRGIVWHELAEGPTGLIPASFFESVDGLLIDGDAKQWRTAGFIIRERTRSCRDVAEDFGLPVDMVRGRYDSHFQSALNTTIEGRTSQAEESAADLCVYYEVYSRIGIGQTLKGASDELKGLQAGVEQLGPYIYLAILPGMKTPLNLPDTILETGDIESLVRALEWPVAFYEDLSNPWPCTPLDYYPNQDDPWATSPLESALPLQEFLDHAYSFLMSRIRITARDIIVVSKDIEEALLAAIHSGFDQEIVGVSGSAAAKVADAVEILKFPPVNQDLWSVIQMVERAFERAAGMDPTMYGSQPTSADRSAEATRAREGHLTSRPTDLADTTEQWMSDIAAKEAQLMRLYIGPEVVAPLFGEDGNVDPDTGELITMGPLSGVWAQLINTDDPAKAVSDMMFTVEAGSGQRKNKAKVMADAQQVLQMHGQQAYAYGAQYGDFSSYNELLMMVGEAMDIPMHRLALTNVAPEPIETEGDSDSGQ